MLTVDIATQIYTIMRQPDQKFLTQGSKSLKPMLKSLYCLICSSLSYDISQGDSCSRPDESGFKLKFENTVTLSRILFEELRERLLNTAHDISMVRDVGWPVDLMDSVEELLLLLRCCILMVRLNPYDQILIEKFQDAVSLVCILPFQNTLTGEERSIGFKEVISFQSMYHCSFSHDFGAKSSASSFPLLNRMLEVILDEMFGDKPFRECISTLDTFSSPKGNQSLCSIHIESVLDVIASHFLVSVSGEKAFQDFTESLIWAKKQTLCTPELSLTAAISLVKHPVMSPPTLLLAHLISLVSEVIGIGDFLELGPSFRCMEVYLSIFQDSVKLYSGQMAKLLPNFSTSPYERERNDQRPLESHFHSKIYDRVFLMLVDWESSWREHIGKRFNKTKSGLATDSILYLQMNIHIVEESRRDKVFSFLSSLLTRIISTEVNEVVLQKCKEMTVQDFCLLASLLKLMSCSMLQAIFRFRKTLCCLKSLSKHKDALQGYHSLVGIMCSLGLYNFPLPIQVQELIVDAFIPHCSTTYDDFKMILMHFGGLLSLCIVSRLDFLVRGCLFMMMVVLNVLFFEESSLEISRPSVSSGLESHSPAFSQTKVTSVATSIAHKDSIGRIQKMSSLRVASNFQRTRQIFLRDQTTYKDEETRNGEVYLRHFTNNLEDIADLADFIECKPWKNYTAWLRNLAESRYRRQKKLARRQWQRKKKLCNSLGSKRKMKEHPNFKTTMSM